MAPAGAVSVVVGVEDRKESSSEIWDSLTNLGLNGGNALPDVTGSYNVKEAFAETVVPILKDDKDTPGVMAFCEKVRGLLTGKTALGEPLRVKIDSRDRKSQDKRWDWVRR